MGNHGTWEDHITPVQSLRNGLETEAAYVVSVAASLVRSLGLPGW
jgi:hypothetical protein